MERAWFFKCKGLLISINIQDWHSPDRAGFLLLASIVGAFGKYMSQVLEIGILISGTMIQIICLTLKHTQMDSPAQLSLSVCIGTKMAQ